MREFSFSSYFLIMFHENVEENVFFFAQNRHLWQGILYTITPHYPEWRKRDEAVPIKAKTCQFAGKVLATVFWDWKGILYKGRTSFWIKFVLHTGEKAMAASLQRFCSSLLTLGLVQLLIRVRNYKKRTEPASIQHLPSCPYLSSYNFHVFGALEESDITLTMRLKSLLTVRPRFFFLHCWHWKSAKTTGKSIDCEGDNVEKLWQFVYLKKYILYKQRLVFIL